MNTTLLTKLTSKETKMTKAQLIDFIFEKFQEPDGKPVSKSKLDAMKKADLEELIESKNLTEELNAYAN